LLIVLLGLILSGVIFKNWLHTRFNEPVGIGSGMEHQ
jgi:hypothetical protein